MKEAKDWWRCLHIKVKKYWPNYRNTNGHPANLYDGNIFRAK
jgi:hypothetical protein